MRVTSAAPANVPANAEQPVEWEYEDYDVVVTCTAQSGSPAVVHGDLLAIVTG